MIMIREDRVDGIAGVKYTFIECPGLKQRVTDEIFYQVVPYGTSYITGSYALIGMRWF